jgi:hypothetical protein
MDTTFVFDLYVPSWMEGEGHSQPLATALSLNAGKNSCHQHFLQRCRTFLQRLPPEQRAAVPARVFDTISLQWSPLPTGSYQGKPEGCLETPLAVLANLTYQLHPKA